MAITSLARLADAKKQQFTYIASPGNGSDTYYARRTNPVRAITFTNPTGTNLTYLSNIEFGSSIFFSANIPRYVHIYDTLYGLGGIANSTALQTINTGPFAARDINGTNNGDGVYAALVQASGNASNAAGTCTISYTNSVGTSGRTGTVSYFANIQSGPVFYFNLSNGDVGVRSIETLQFSTTGSGLFLFVIRPIAITMLGTNKYGTMTEDAISLGMPQIYNGTSIDHAYGGGSGFFGTLTFSQG